MGEGSYVATFRMEPQKNMAAEDFEEILRIQQMMSQRLMQEQRTDRKIDLLNTITDLTDGGTRRVHIEAVLLEAAQRGLSEDQVTKILDDLESDRLIERSDGFVRRV